MRLTQSYVVRFVSISYTILFNSVFLPYPAGVLEAYAKKHAPDPNRYTFLPAFYQRTPLKKAAQEFQYVDIAAFNVYSWNEQYSLALAAELKRQFPEILIIFGGAQIPRHVAPYLEKHAFIDVCAMGVGEATFLNLLEAYPENQWSEIPGICYRDSTGQIKINPEAPRTNNLLEIPSPYLTGVFDSLLKTQVSHQWVGSLETNRGCPFSCTFCDWGVIQAKVYEFEMERIRQEIEWFGKNQIKVVLANDANFGMLERDKEIGQALIASKLKYKAPDFMIFQTAKAASEHTFEVLRDLYRAGISEYVNVSLQSVSGDVLKHIKRDNLPLEAYHFLVTRFQETNIPTYTEFLLGLPGDTYDSFADGVSQVISEGQHSYIRFHEVEVLANAEMADPEYQKEFGIETMVTEFRWGMNQTEQLMEEEIPELQEIIIATATLPKEDWVRMRALAWMIDITYFNKKTLQIPMVLIHSLLGISYRNQFEHFLELPRPQSPIFESMADFMFKKAQRIQQGESISCKNVSVLGRTMLVPTPDFILWGLSESQALDEYYTQAEQVLAELIKNRLGSDQIPDWLHEACQLNRALSFNHSEKKGVDLVQNHNIWEFYQKTLVGEKAELKVQKTRYSSPLFRRFEQGRYHDELNIQVLA